MGRSVRIDVAPGILKSYRESSGWTVEEVGAKLKMPPDEVVRLESGRASMTFTQLDKLSAAFRYPVAMFLLDEPPKQKPIKDYRFLPDGRRTFDKQTHYAMRESRHLQRIGLELLENLGRPAEPEAEKVSLDDSPTEVASKYRTALELTEDKQREFKNAYDMFDYLRLSLESANVLVFQFPLPVEDAGGFALADKLPVTMAVSSEDVAEARLFTLMHEFGHVLLRDASIDAPAVGRGRSVRERWCDEFSSSFLLPDQIALGLSSEHGALSRPDALERLSAEYNVGKDLVLHRMKILGGISAAEYRKAREIYGSPDIQTRTRSARMSVPQRRVSKLGDLFVSLVSDNLDGQHITYADVVRYLSIKSKYFDSTVARVRL